ncbi:hypothetical protein [Reyranella sp.]|uniref:hypothetical protein n=1 Tax=Reyranella sp. TaxID=1929291 RepID=UPI000BD3AE06|nr:hypothetical protein [Reyranella sp.]OYY44236.1 MAG: hypothetical protein B7Y57_08345 [Rhodospirillales bacterium 35-66-84]OYZ94912.1 MAG: hypothetical protein B7Y08_11225 [Rhodospirillales bacterium 24-66-33]OZB26276.1 MAG: hypothetical protein B7X63_08985 [Rhodospirillales bacterium 39-66-50]HQS15219.1 hypothetical protein [Reyranella sp.]HQT11028.1 hypothetical protein [Reyranella sp.]
MSRYPPVPPAARSPKGPCSDPASVEKTSQEDARRAQQTTNLEDQGDSGNISQYTNQGYQRHR